MSTRLNSTAIALVLSATATFVAAQETAACDPSAPQFPCSLDGAVIADQAQFLAITAPEVAPSVEAAPEVIPETVVEQAVAAEVEPKVEPLVEQAVAPEVEAAPEAEVAPLVEVAPVVEEAPVVEDVPAVEVAPEVEVAPDVEVTPEVEAVPEAAVAPEVDGLPVVEPAPEAEVAPVIEVTPEVEAVVEPEVEAILTPDVAPEAQAAPAAEVPVEPVAAPDVDVAQEGDAVLDAFVEPDTAAAGETEAVALSESEEALAAAIAAELGATAPEGEVIDPEALTDETPPAPEDTVVEVETSAAATATPEEASATVEEETVSEEDVRSSAEDFEVSVSDTAVAPNADRGLSDFETALLIGLGAVAIGAILDNGDEVVSNSGDRVVLQQPDGSYRVLKDDDVLLRQPGSNVRVERFDDGSSRTFVTQPDGNEVVTIRSAEGRVLRRALVLPDGSQVELFNDTVPEQAVDVTVLPRAALVSPAATSMGASDVELRAALMAQLDAGVDRTFSLRQVRTISQVRELAPLVDLDAITFATGSAAIQPDQARDLTRLGTAILDIVQDRPGEVFLIEGHTDATGSASYNLALSDRRAESVALALTEYFGVPAANLVTQGYGETALKIRTLEAEEANRRASVRNITQLLR